MHGYNYNLHVHAYCESIHVRKSQCFVGGSTDAHTHTLLNFDYHDRRCHCTDISRSQISFSITEMLVEEINDIGNVAEMADKELRTAKVVTLHKGCGVL